MEPATLRIHLSGRIAIDTGGTFLGPEEFPGQQGRAAFAFLVGQRQAPVSRSAVADAIWPSRPPPSWDTALSSIVSKLRSLLCRAGLDGTDALPGVGGCYELRLPRGTWVDHEVAADAIHEAEAALKAGDPARAYGPSAVAQHIARRPFLPGQEGHWFERRREKLAGILVRALECRAEIYLWNREYPLAVESARDVVALRPFRESAYRLLMRAHASAGNAAEALRVYERCRAVISEELGVNPSPDTQALHAQVLASL
jgi:SARP family transcriptional regulator, regulator of embCAB operon